MNKYKKLILAIFLILTLFFPLNKIQAAVVWGVDPGIMIDLIKINDTINGTILGILKQTAAMSIDLQINNLIGGGSIGSARFIVDWQDYLIDQPVNQANKYINSYIDQTLSGKGALNYMQVGFSGCFGGVCLSQGNPSDGKNYADYSSEGFFSSGANAAANPNPASGLFTARNYRQQLAEIAKKATLEAPAAKVTYEGNPSINMFSQGNFKNMSSYLSGINNPWAFKQNAEEAYQAKIEEGRTKQLAKSQAYSGMIGAGEKNGQGLITNPGSIIKETVTNAQNIGNQIIATATHPQEIVTAVVSQMINKSIQQGIGNIEGYAQNAVNKVNRVNQIMTSRVQTLGPGAIYN